MTKRPRSEQRYDRQLRLWGDHGQLAIESSKVCLIRASAVGCEILKNLVLPGVGSFTIVDDAAVTETDLGSNFFLCENDLHKPRAQVVTQCLLELNEAVQGNYVVEKFSALLSNDPQFFLGFNVIIVTDAREGLLVRLSRILQDTSIPLVICFTIGFIGYLRVSATEHVIIESHPDATRPDLRLDRPPPGLVEMANEVTLEEMTSEQLAHTPWLIIVYIFLQKFIQQYNHFPQNHEEKSTLRKMIMKGGTELLKAVRMREPNLEPSYTLENFQEAGKAVNTAVCPTEIPAEVRELLEDERCTEGAVISHSLGGATSLMQTSTYVHPDQIRSGAPSSVGVAVPSPTTFWRLVCALRDFVQNEGEGQLPVRGSIPDMLSDSKRYLKLLSIYQERMEWAVQRFAARLKQFPEITLQDIRLFVRNSAFLRVVRCRSLEEELKLSPARSEDLALIPTHEENDSMLWYLVLRGASSFLSENGHWPGDPNPYSSSFHTNVTSTLNHVLKTGDGQSKGQTNDQKTEATGKEVADSYVVETDLPGFRAHLNRILRAFGIASPLVSLDYVNEMCRFGGGELHSVAAFMGGIVSQEVIKLLTHQFVPITKPLIYNAIAQRTELIDF
ncbi:NEDD8-activating enzyme E1 regulatory subunit [Clonorchis sinensis]|uniref:NEDD8-activating enzyme E1 regulatory subunit n=1 Tax=Clonorchis sinensis TaxID=79923 RepID=A0A8T1MJD9_CLOSI|nr:NEDD8-activating enzyme E1 regulatory subunit [Clonorchis sinensis]